MNQKKFGAITSSQDPEQVANTVKGLVLSFSAIIILLAQQFFHLSLSANDVASFATEASVAAGAVWTLYGLVMKLLVLVFKPKVAPPPTV
jgi:hypothetical protein